MAAVQRKLVHKQFNSPMGLYSQQNVKETLDRELKAFGADGIEVDEQITKPLNLANSAVLRAVEEEEEMKCGYKRVAWPPVSEERIIREFTPQPQAQPPQGQYYNQPAQQPTQQSAQQPKLQQQPAAVAPAQGPIYNNVQPAARQNSPYPNQYQQSPTQQQQQQPPQHYQPQQQQQYQPPQQQYEQPIQYTQAQFNRQPSREPPQPAATNAPYQSQPNQQPNNYPYQTVQEPSSPSGWKHIQAPLPKQHAEFQCPLGSEPNYSAYQPAAQQQPPQQHYSAPTYNNYQQPPQSQPQYQNPQYQQPNQQYQAPNQYQYQATQPQQPSWVQQQQQQPQQQPNQYQPQQQYQAPTNYQTQTPLQQTQQYQQPNQYNSYSQPQHTISQDQTDYQQPQQQQQPLPQDYRGGSPGIITLRKEAPVTQVPAPVYTSQPAAVSFRGGSNMRGDLKWPPPEYKEAAAQENEERRKLALGPVCRPRKINRDYTTFFAKNALNCYYPSYKVPPGTQHMFA